MHLDLSRRVAVTRARRRLTGCTPCIYDVYPFFPCSCVRLMRMSPPFYNVDVVIVQALVHDVSLCCVGQGRNSRRGVRWLLGVGA